MLPDGTARTFCLSVAGGSGGFRSDAPWVHFEPHDALDGGPGRGGTRMKVRKIDCPTAVRSAQFVSTRGMPDRHKARDERS